MTQYTPEQIALIRSNAAAAELQRAVDELAVAIIPDQIAAPDGKRTRRSVQFAYEANGGDLKLAVWAKDNWGEFITKVWVKMVDKQPEAAAVQGIEDILDVIDGQVIDAEFQDVIEPRE
jgi:hypothetical protein